MPEYLSPAVYVEEVDSGSKPIEGVSTSTASVVGVAERGPLDVPVLVTSTGDYARLFGGLLDLSEFGRHGYLPLAVEGFFRNGGRRLFVSRVASAAASPAALTLLGAGAGAAPAGALLRAASAGGTAIAVLDAGLSPGERVRVGEGSDAEWPTVQAAAPGNLYALNAPLLSPAPLGAPVFAFKAEPDTTASVKGVHALHQPAERGATTILVAVTTDATDLTKLASDGKLPKRVLDLRAGNASREVVRIAGIALAEPKVFRVTLARPLALAHPAGASAEVLVADEAAAVETDALAGPALAGDAAIETVKAPAGAVVQIGSGIQGELRRVAKPGRIALAGPLPRALPRGAAVEHVTVADAGPARTLTRAAPRGARQVTVSSRDGLAAGAVLRLGEGAGAEFAVVEALPGAAPDGSAAGPGPVTLAHGLAGDREANDAAALQTVTATPAADAGVLLLSAEAGATSLLSSQTGGYPVGGLVRVTGTGGAPLLLPASAAAAAAPTLLTLAGGLAGNHPAGASLAGREPVLEVEALDAGSWGDRLRISAEEEASGLSAQAAATGVVGPDRIKVSSLAGIERGTVLELGPSGAPLGSLLKVTAVNRADGSATLAAPLSPDQLAAVGAPGARVPLRSREFRLTVRLLRRPDPAVPARDDAAELSETFRHLSLDPRHSRYVGTVIGLVDGPPRLWDRRPEGESLLVRVRDVATGPAAEAVRLGPEALVDRLPSGAARPARHALSGGDDGLAALGDQDFIGQDAREPAERRGLASLRNEDDIALVACPGQVSPAIQQALVEHCEAMRYRFAVLDGPAPPNDAIADALALRQTHDSKHAALYHPWLTIPDPRPGNLATVAQVPVPPSGHVLGIYARTDLERGVHKAPANEVVRGISGLRRALNKAEHDLLNPFPVNVNVIRDFRPENRGIRIWGARVLTSDPDYKYVPVRRLLLFLEKSIERSLTWVVFEPNAEPLWARVRFSIQAFLETVWRNGALEGTSPEEAFFVVCDRSTMTQADIDNGRLICAVGVAPVKPAEFVIIRIGLKTAVAGD